MADKENMIVDEDRKIEDIFKELEEISKKMNDPECLLEESFDLYKRGVNLCKICYAKIDDVEKELTILNERQD